MAKQGARHDRGGGMCCWRRWRQCLPLRASDHEPYSAGWIDTWQREKSRTLICAHKQGVVRFFAESHSQGPKRSKGLSANNTCDSTCVFTKGKIDS